jgi:hypothetical protein
VNPLESWVKNRIVMRIISWDLKWSSIRYSLGGVVWLVKAQVVVVVVQSFNSHIRGPYFVMIMNLQVVLKAGCWLRDRFSYPSADFLKKSLVKGHYWILLMISHQYSISPLVGHPGVPAPGPPDSLPPPPPPPPRLLPPPEDFSCTNRQLSPFLQLPFW